SMWSITCLSGRRAVATADANGAHYLKSPRVSAVDLDPGPAHIGGICSFGIFCSVVPNADRSLADSIAVAIDPAGGANAVWTENSTGTNEIDFACQNAGPSFYAGLPSLKGCDVAG